MQSTNKPKKTKPWSTEDLQKAVSAVKGKALTLRKAADQFGVPRATIDDHGKGRSKKIGAGRHTVFTSKQKNELKEHLLKAERCLFGFTSEQTSLQKGTTVHIRFQEKSR